jgi:hypothetical protein
MYTDDISIMAAEPGAEPGAEFQELKETYDRYQAGIKNGEYILTRDELRSLTRRLILILRSGSGTAAAYALAIKILYV